MIVGLALDRFLRWRWLHVHVNARAVNILFVNIERIHDDLKFLYLNHFIVRSRVTKIPFFS